MWRRVTIECKCSFLWSRPWMAARRSLSSRKGVSCESGRKLNLRTGQQVSDMGGVGQCFLNGMGIQALNTALSLISKDTERAVRVTRQSSVSCPHGGSILGA